MKNFHDYRARWWRWSAASYCRARCWYCWFSTASLTSRILSLSLHCCGLEILFNAFHAREMKYFSFLLNFLCYRLGTLLRHIIEELRSMKTKIFYFECYREHRYLFLMMGSRWTLASLKQPLLLDDVKLFDWWWDAKDTLALIDCRQVPDRFSITTYLLAHSRLAFAFVFGHTPVTFTDDIMMMCASCLPRPSAASGHALIVTPHSPLGCCSMLRDNAW